MTEETLPPLIETPLGLYRHYKGMLYDVVGTVRQEFLGSEPKFAEPTARPKGAVRCTAAKLVSDPNNSLYRALYGEHGL